MSRIVAVTHEACRAHDPRVCFGGHPERPARLDAVLRGLLAARPRADVVDAPALDPEDLTLVHDPDYVAAIERFCAEGGGPLDPDTCATPASWEAALRAAGGTVLAAEIASPTTAAFAAVRPPGHHAEADRAMGFCLFDNVAVAARVRTRAGERVAIVDWDVHHGNGTQELFASDPAVLYLSIHQFPFYPGTGWVDETGFGPGAGTTVNVPVPAGTRGDLYRAAFERVFGPILQAYAPDRVLISCGFDAHRRDPLAHVLLDDEDYGWMAAYLRSVLPGIPIAVTLEGGYDLDALEAGARLVSEGLIGSIGVDDLPRSDGTASPANAWQRLALVVEAVSPFWPEVA